MQIIPVSIEETLAKSYLEYSMSVIVGRALPDVRDGLKPVHRRILYAMYKMGISANSPYKKSARIVGDVIGKYHPHGDSAVYEALVRMAQPFSMRMPLIDGQGNFGSIDGDNAAAMRYTEARLTKIAEELLKDIDKDTVDFIPNYDGSEKEPVVLPARFPNLLVNGSSGIAVGMATNIPPHNLSELIDALIYMIDNKNAKLEDILKFVKGPDFPTGGTIFGKSGIIEAYKTGRGSIKIRAKHHIEHKGNKEVIVIDELPYQVNKAKLIEKISDLVKDKVLDGISEVRDESDREGIRVVIELKKDAMSEIILNNLYKHTQMQVSFGVNMLGIYDKQPKLFNLFELLDIFIKHRKTVVIRRTIYELEEAKRRAHILEGLRIALANIDEVVELIKKSADTKEAKANLIDRFELSEIQAQAILDMKLSRLTSLEIERLEKEYKELMEKIEYLNSILKSEEVLNGVIKDELLEIKKKYPTPRLTDIVDDYDEIDIEDLIPNEEMVLTITHRGYVKRVPLKIYERQNRGGKGKKALTTYEDDFIEDFYVANAHDTLMIITNKGQLHWLKVYKIPEGSRTSKGKAIVNLINLDKDEQIQTIIRTSDFDENRSLAFFTKNGIVKRTNLNEFKNVRSTGVRAITIDENDELVTATIVEPEDKELFIVTKKGQAIRFPVDTVREMGRGARGVKGITFKIQGDEVVGALALKDENQEILSVSEKGFGKRSEANLYRLTNRGGKGVIAMKLTNKTGDLVGVVATEENHDLMVLTSSGKMIRVSIDSISKTGKNTQGVRIVKLDSGDKVVSIAKTPSETDEIEEENN
ncbi:MULTISPECIES: DNA gyrase subunit A [unclassified Lebetimonas]|uniref:DNA gyrase subunit A n=1 Tax=unclassified Lebetimonas TaxID=2648158 RepID=UPI000463C485|nr:MULTISPECIES: DNA gyrase subunit A [unclassified Lebetimonas]